MHVRKRRERTGMYVHVLDVTMQRILESKVYHIKINIMEFLLASGFDWPICGMIWNNFCHPSFSYFVTSLPHPDVCTVLNRTERITVDRILKHLAEHIVSKFKISNAIEVEDVDKKDPHPSYLM